MKSGKINVGSWLIRAIEYDDGHLTLSLEHADGSKVIDVGELDALSGDHDYTERFTTEQIEKDYALNEYGGAS